MTQGHKGAVKVSEILKAVLVRPVAFHVVLARLCHSALAGLMLSQALYWTEVLTRTKPEAGGWFYKTRQEWDDELHLSRWEQQAARSILRNFNFWQEQLRGVPARMYFRVDLQKLTAAVAQMVEKQPTSLSRIQLDAVQPTGWMEFSQQAGGNTTNIPTETTSETTPDITGGSASSALRPQDVPESLSSPTSNDWDECVWSEEQQDWVTKGSAPWEHEQRSECEGGR